MRNYEIMYIIDPVILEEGRDAVIAKVNNILTEAGATVTKSDKWGERKLAYPINKKKTGFYVLATLEMDGTNLVEVERKLNITEDVIRYILVKKD